MFNIKALSKFDQNQVVSLYKTGNYTQQELADNFGVSVDTIRRVLKNDKESKLSKTISASLKAAVGVAINAPVTVTVEVPVVEDTIGGSRPEIVWNASSKFVSITEGRTVWNATKDHKHFDDIIQALKESRFDDAIEFISIKAAVQKYVKGDVRIEGGSLFYQGIELRSGLVTRIIDSMQNGEDFEFYLPFLENLLENPSEKAVQRLFDFLVANDIEITEDGHFITWKMVRATYKDCHSNTFDNSPGQYVKMPRSRVNDNDEQTCSTGLHVCSKGYIGSGFGHGDGRIVSCKVHPRDVVSIPVDYNDSKMRVCGYLVLDDVTEQF
ncbi:protector from prophage-induced early lysis [Escherichia phage DK-13]|nr:protector from prophage-induced early lysis [Escherichia phage DK-13]